MRSRIKRKTKLAPTKWEREHSFVFNSTRWFKNLITINRLVRNKYYISYKSPYYSTLKDAQRFGDYLNKAILNYK